ncbi:unnamed protein product [Brassica oleracea]
MQILHFDTASFTACWSDRNPRRRKSLSGSQGASSIFSASPLLVPQGKAQANWFCMKMVGEWKQAKPPPQTATTT